MVFPAIVYIGASGMLEHTTEKRIFQFLSDMSYPLYMTHYTLVYFYVAWVSDHKGISLTESWPYALLTLAGAIALAYVSLKFFDEPVRFWIRKKFK